MSKDWYSKVKAHIFYRLALGFVDGHCKCKANRKLAVRILKRDLSMMIKCGSELDTDIVEINGIIAEGIIKSISKSSMEETLIITKISKVILINCCPHINNIPL